MKIITIIQARMGSQRLPGKVLLSLGDSDVLDYVVSRCKLIECDEVIVATSTLSADDKIAEWCEKRKVSVFRGSESDVLSRYYECSVVHQADYIVRVTSDCPFVDFDQANQAIATIQKAPADLVVFSEEQPRGLTVDFMSFSALESCYRNGKEPHYREHVTLYAYDHIDQFQTVYCEIPDLLKQPQLRITLDTKEDFELISQVANSLMDKLVSSEDVIKFLLRHPEIAKINSAISQKPVK